MLTQASAHESLADLLMRFLAEVGTSSHSYAELAGRTASNINDVVRILLCSGRMPLACAPDA